MMKIHKENWLRHIWHLLGVVAFILMSVFFIRLRIPCDDLPAEEAKRITIMSSFIFFVSVPCFFAVFRLLFGRYVGVLLSAFYVIVCLFPYKYLFPSDVDLFRMYFLPPPGTIFGCRSTWLLLGYFLLAVCFASFYWRLKKHRWCPVINWRQVLPLTVLLGLCLVQILTRMDERSPNCVMLGIHRGAQPGGKWSIGKMRDIMPFPEGVSEEPQGYFGGHVLVDPDLLHHHIPIAMFRGGPEERSLLRKGVNNRRPLAPYIYSNLSMFFDPYHTSIVINGIFYLFIVIGGYRLAEYLKLPRSVPVSFGILLSCNFFIVWRTMLWTFYIQNHAFAVLMLLFAYRLQIMSKPGVGYRQLVFCCLLASLSLTYDPFIFCAMILLWGMVNSVVTLRKGAVLASVKHVSNGICIAITPMVVQKVWERILANYSMLGNPDNYQARDDVLVKLLLLPDWASKNPWEFLYVLNSNLTKLVIGPVRDCTYWSSLELFGIVCLFAVLWRMLHSKDRVGVYSCYFGNLGSTLLASLAAAVPPLMRHSVAFLKLHRCYNAFPVLVLSQSVGLNTVAKCFANLLGFKAVWISEMLTILAAGVIYALSFGRMLFP